MREIFLFSIFYKRDKSIFSYFAFLYSYLVYLLSVNPTFWPLLFSPVLLYIILVGKLLLLYVILCSVKIVTPLTSVVFSSITLFSLAFQ